MLKTLVKKEPALVIDEEGILDNSTALSNGRIKWWQMNEITYDKQFRRITIGVKDPKYFIQKTSNPLKKIILWMNWKFDKSPIHLNDQLMKIDIQKLMELLSTGKEKDLPFDDFLDHLIDKEA